MTDTEFMELHWDYPLFIIGTVNGDVVTVEYEGYQSCLIYKQKELAELYVEQSAEAGTGQYHAIPIASPQEFRNGLASLASQGISHTIWDSTYHPSGCIIGAIADLLDALSTEPPASD